MVHDGPVKFHRPTAIFSRSVSGRQQQESPHDDSCHAASPRPRRRRVWWVVLLVTGIVAGIAVATVPVNVVIESPGPTWNVLGSASSDAPTSGQDALLTLKGTPTYDVDGALRMTTVAVRGCPGYPVTSLDVINAWFHEDHRIVSRDSVCPASMSEEDIAQINQAQMTGSEHTAVVAALAETGLATREILTVTGVSDDQHSTTLTAGDVLSSLTLPDGTRHPIDTLSGLRDILSSVAPGTALTVEVIRDGQAVSSPLTTIVPGDDDGDGTPDRPGSVLGLFLEVEADSDITASFDLEEVGGPSAGLMFALGIVDRVTPGSLTGGLDIAGTGTMSVDGTVGPIGGIEQKIAGAAHDGASVFLAPVSNCSEVVGHEPETLKVYAVGSLHEAVRVVQSLAAGQDEGLRTCEAVTSK